MWHVNDIKNIICNPIYVGIGPFPQILTDDQWIKCAERSIQEMGAQVFLIRMLMVLRNSFAKVVLVDGHNESEMETL